jgi:hypothetical protein
MLGDLFFELLILMKTLVHKAFTLVGLLTEF